MRSKNKALLKTLVTLIVGFVGGYNTYDYQSENNIFLQERSRPQLEQRAELTCSNTTIYFSPNTGCEQQIIHQINGAKSQILIQVYLLTSIEITKALIKARKKGIEIKVLYDRSQINQEGSQIGNLTKAGIVTKVDYVPGIAHNKVMIIDQHIVITGSYNFTAAANLRNAENLLIIDDVEIAKIYYQNWYNRFAKPSKDISFSAQQVKRSKIKVNR